MDRIDRMKGTGFDPGKEVPVVSCISCPSCKWIFQAFLAD
jgi:hypothetical protein